VGLSSKGNKVRPSALPGPRTLASGRADAQTLRSPTWLCGSESDRSRCGRGPSPRTSRPPKTMLDWVPAA
jgi:hypothetical protein